jgi:drug/metabolite transporter (DMT)-like permease
MSWFTAAVFSAIALSGQGLAFQRLQGKHPINVFMTYIWLGAGFVLAIFFLPGTDLAVLVRNMHWLVFSGLCSWVGIYAYNRAIQLQTNIGYIEAVAALRIVLTYVYSIAAFGAVFEGIKLTGVVLVMIGVFAVAGTLRIRRSDLSLDWLVWGLLAGLCFGLLTIAVRYATDDGVDAKVATLAVLFVAGTMFLCATVVSHTSLRLERRHYPMVVITIAFASVGNATEFIAFERTPNLAYAIAIDNTRMIILFLVGMFLFSEELNRVRALGIIFTFSGVILLS